MTPADLQKLRARAASDVLETHSRQQLIARIKRNREDVATLLAEVERQRIDLADADDDVLKTSRSLHEEIDRLRSDLGLERVKVAAYEKRLEREWSPPKAAK